VENAVRSIEGVKKVQSRGYPGFGTVTLEFDAGFDNQKALRNVQRKVDEVRSKLPQEMEEPEVHEINAGLDPVLDGRSLRPRARAQASSPSHASLRDDLAGVKGVLEVDVDGDRGRDGRNPGRSAEDGQYGISQEELFNLFVRNNRLIAAGVLDTGNGRFAVKLPGVIENVTDVQNLPVKASGDRVVKFL